MSNKGIRTKPNIDTNKVKSAQGLSEISTDIKKHNFPIKKKTKGHINRLVHLIVLYDILSIFLPFVIRLFIIILLLLKIGKQNLKFFT